MHERDSIVATTGTPKCHQVFVIVRTRQRAQYRTGAGRRRRPIQNDSPLQKAAKAHRRAHYMEVFCPALQRTRTHARQVNALTLESLKGLNFQIMHLSNFGHTQIFFLIFFHSNAKISV